MGLNNKWLGWVVLGLLFICFGIGQIDSDKDYYARLIYAGGLAFVMVGFSIREQQLHSAWPILFLMMGNASYSIYLVHVPLLSVTQRLAGHVGFSWAQALLFGVACSMLAGYFYYLVVERPALRFFKKYSDRN
jgi:peptidoglycan/LPS O-acetylase OafA/YrhL